MARQAEGQDRSDSGKQPKPTDRPLFRRYSDSELNELAKAPEPVSRREVTAEQVEWPSDVEDQVKYYESLSPEVQENLSEQFFAFVDTFGQFSTTKA